MPIVSGFGVWDQELRVFINAICSEATGFSKEEVTAWFYEQGIVLMYENHTKLYTALNRKYMDKHGFRPDMTTSAIEKIHSGVLLELMPAFVYRFAPNDMNLSQYITFLYGEFVQTAIINHSGFYSLQADIASVLNHMLNETPAISDTDLFNHAVTLFLEHKKAMPAMAKEIDDHVTLMKEIAAHHAAQNQKLVKPAILSPALFKAAAKPASSESELKRTSSCSSGLSLRQ